MDPSSSTDYQSVSNDEFDDTASSIFYFQSQYDEVLGRNDMRNPAMSEAQLGMLEAGAKASMALHELHARGDEKWKPVTHHKSGAVVYQETKYRGTSVFKGVSFMHGFAPDAVFAVITRRALWDDWFQEGHVVEQLDDFTSINYMVMKPQTALSQAFASERDVVTIDRKDFDHSTGTIAYASASVDTPKVPKHPGRVRALLKLSGWVLESAVASDGVTASTRVTYYIHTEVGGMLPKSIVKRYMARRALAGVQIEEYLRKNGPPKMAGSDAAAAMAFRRRQPLWRLPCLLLGRGHTRMLLHLV
ncbi:hypothetical protein BC832DRAFT_154929 [Gaertneriomyces semiglobifer]|nr:hypothetical protein BC832DRAFT_154929 [Gaertneriomyces semiglobifer]